MPDDELDILGEVDLSTISPQDFARLVKDAPKDQMAELMGRDELRTRVLDEVFSRMKDQYIGRKSVDAVIHWKILDKPGGGYDHYETVLKDGTCEVGKDPQHEPRVTIKLSGGEFLKLASGNASPPVMFMTGKLKLQGDVGFAAGLSNLFDIPKA